MFTGIIEEIGRITTISHGPNSASLTISATTVCEGTRIGDSIAVNGVCLTVTSCASRSFTVDVMAETLSKTTIGELKTGSAVNLERALMPSSRIGGHLFSGHVDGTGTIVSIRKMDIASILTINCPTSLLKYCIEKGSVTLDGVSLTLCSVTDTSISVSIIPHTTAVTVFRSKRIGDRINIECDMIAKYVEKLFLRNTPSADNIQNPVLTELFLRQNGFMEE